MYKDNRRTTCTETSLGMIKKLLAINCINFVTSQHLRNASQAIQVADLVLFVGLVMGVDVVLGTDGGLVLKWVVDVDVDVYVDVAMVVGASVDVVIHYFGVSEMDIVLDRCITSAVRVEMDVVSDICMFKDRCHRGRYLGLRLTCRGVDGKSHFHNNFFPETSEVFFSPIKYKRLLTEYR